jgi:hypothetical protein
MTYLRFGTMVAALLGVAAVFGACSTAEHDDGRGPGSQTQCQGFFDETGHSVRLRVRNDTGVDMYLDAGSGTTPVYRLVPASGDDGRFYGAFDRTCMQTCAELQYEDIQACNLELSAPTVVRVRAGESLDILWDGAGSADDVEMPGSCFHDPSAAGPCTRIVAPPPGEYQLQLTAYAACDDHDGDLVCDCDADDVCQGEPFGASASPAPVSLVVPVNEQVVDVVFEICAFGCPSG